MEVLAQTVYTTMKKNIVNWGVWAWSYMSLGFVYFTFFWMRVYEKDSQGNLIAFHPGLWSDWPAHFTMGSAMATRSLFLSTSPLLIGAPFQYHFLANFFTAILNKLGVSLVHAFSLTSYLYCLFFVFALFFFFRALFKSEKIAVLASVLFLLNGGLGFIDFIKDLIQSSNIIDTILYPPHRYTSNDGDGLFWKSILDTSLIPQRGFQFGFGLTLFALGWVIMLFRLGPKTGKKKETISPHWVWLIILILGFMPIGHVHSFLSAFILLVFWTITDYLRNKTQFKKDHFTLWFRIAIGTGIIALPLIVFYLLSDPSSDRGINWAPGWYAPETKMNWVLFWIKNWSITPFLAIAGLVLYYKNQPANQQKFSLLFFAPFFFIFIFGNLFSLQPWLWDNTKILAWAAVGFSGLAAYAIVLTWEKNKYVAGLLFTLCIFSGLLDAYRVQVHKLNRVQIYTREDLELAEWVRDTSNPNSVWLTSEKSNHWLYNLTGRQPVMAYTGWLWSHGVDHMEIKRDVREMFSNPLNHDLFKKYGVDYAVVDPSAVSQFGADRSSFQDSYPIYHQSDTYVIYNVQKPPSRRFYSALDIRPASLSASSLKPGFRQLIYNNIEFEGSPVKIIPTVSTVIGFWYNYREDRPFPETCSMEWEGYIKIPESGSYVFYIESDDGSWLELGGKEIINNGGRHGVKEAFRRVNLKKGYYPIRLSYFDDGGGAILNFRWKKPKGLRELVPATLFYQKK